MLARSDMLGPSQSSQPIEQFDRILALIRAPHSSVKLLGEDQRARLSRYLLGHFERRLLHLHLQVSGQANRPLLATFPLLAILSRVKLDRF